MTTRMTRDKVVSPREIFFTQDSICVTFTKPRDQERIDDAANLIIQGKLSPKAFPKVNVVEFQNQLWSLDNRRLWVFKKAEVDLITVTVVSYDFHPRFNTFVSTSPYLYSMLSSPTFFPRVRGHCKEIFSSSDHDDPEEPFFSAAETPQAEVRPSDKPPKVSKLCTPATTLQKARIPPKMTKPPDLPLPTKESPKSRRLIFDPDQSHSLPGRSRYSDHVPSLPQHRSSRSQPSVFKKRGYNGPPQDPYSNKRPHEPSTSIRRSSPSPAKKSRVPSSSHTPKAPFAAGRKYEAEPPPAKKLRSRSPVSTPIPKSMPYSRAAKSTVKTLSSDRQSSYLDLTDKRPAAFHPSSSTKANMTTSNSRAENSRPRSADTPAHISKTSVQASIEKMMAAFMTTNFSSKHNYNITRDSMPSYASLERPKAPPFHERTTTSKFSLSAPDSTAKRKLDERAIDISFHVPTLYPDPDPSRGPPQLPGRSICKTSSATKSVLDSSGHLKPTHTPEKGLLIRESRRLKEDKSTHAPEKGSLILKEDKRAAVESERHLPRTPRKEATSKAKSTAGQMARENSRPPAAKPKPSKCTTRKELQDVENSHCLLLAEKPISKELIVRKQPQDFPTVSEQVEIPVKYDTKGELNPCCHSNKCVSSHSNSSAYSHEDSDDWSNRIAGAVDVSVVARLKHPENQASPQRENEDQESQPAIRLGNASPTGESVVQEIQAAIRGGNASNQQKILPNPSNLLQTSPTGQSVVQEIQVAMRGGNVTDQHSLILPEQQIIVQSETPKSKRASGLDEMMRTAKSARGLSIIPIKNANGSLNSGLEIQEVNQPVTRSRTRKKERAKEKSRRASRSATTCTKIVPVKKSKDVGLGRKRLLLKPGDMVYVNINGEVAEKGEETAVSRHPRWHVIGPFEVIRLINAFAARLDLPRDCVMNPVISLTFLKKKLGPLDLLETQKGLPFTLVPEIILNKRIATRVRKRGNEFHYLVKWKNLPASDSTWERDTFLFEHPHLHQNDYQELSNPFLLRNLRAQGLASR